MLLASLFLASLLVLVPGARAQDTLDLDKAVKVGSGHTMVIEFTDPDCPFCRKAEAYFRNKPGVTRYIFFIPLSSHPASKGKVQYILSAKDKARASRKRFLPVSVRNSSPRSPRKGSSCRRSIRRSRGSTR